MTTTRPFIAWHPTYTPPIPEEHRFPKMKYKLLHDQLLYLGIVEEDDFFEPTIMETYFLEGVHDKTYYEKLLSLQLNRKEIQRIGFPLSKELVERELRICQGVIDGTTIAREIGLAFSISGGTHHAGSNWGEGFCLLNDQAIAAHNLTEHQGIKKILIIDLDVHQGNGTAEIFKKDPRVFTFSMHGKNNFPFEKQISNLDLALSDKTTGKDYLPLLKKTLDELFLSVKPEFVFYLCGADVLGTDKLGRLNLSRLDCRDRDRLVFEACHRYQVPVQVSMGGGYSPRIADTLDAQTQTYEEGISIILT